MRDVNFANFKEFASDKLGLTLGKILYIFTIITAVFVFFGDRAKEFFGNTGLETTIAFFAIAAIAILITASAHFLAVSSRAKQFRAATQCKSVSEWHGQGPLRVVAPSQGLRLFYEDQADFRESLKKLAERFSVFLEEAEEANAPETFRAWIDHVRESILDIEINVYNDNGAEAEYETALDNGVFPHPDSPVGRFILNELPASDGMALRLLAFVMFYKKPGLKDQDTTHLKNELISWKPSLADGGEFRVLYELSLNSGRALADIKQERDEIVALKSELVQALENARSTLELKPAANRWQRSARISGFLAFIGLLPFLLLLFGVSWAIQHNWSEITSSISTLFYADDDRTKEAIARLTKFFTDAPWATFVFVTVPVLLFAWTLKHFSRIFIQNMNLATDASRRAALADVYTRIVSDPDLNKDGSAITDEQKKIIFEAMFRPRDPRHTDDGIDYTQVEKIVKAVKDKDGK